MRNAADYDDAASLGPQGRPGRLRRPAGISGKTAAAPTPRALDRLKTAKSANFRQKRRGAAGAVPRAHRVRPDEADAAGGVNSCADQHDAADGIVK